MSNDHLVDPDKQPSSDAFAPLPTGDELLNAQKQPQASTPAPAPAPVTLDGDDIPEKFRGKSLNDLISSYKELESEFGRKSQEVGTLRSMTDQLLELKRTEDLNANGGQPRRQPVTADDLLADPELALSSFTSEATAPVASRVDQLEAQLAMRDFQSRHPTFAEDQNDPRFHEFVRASTYRQGLAQKTLKGDLSAAEELFSAWEENRPAPAKQENTDKANATNQQQLAQAEAIATRGGGESSVDTRKYISRQDIINKRLQDPDGYYDPAFQAWLHTAYREGRVK